MAVAVRGSLLAFLCLAAVPAVVAAQETGAVGGRVTEVGSGTAVTGANVRALAVPTGRVVGSAMTNGEGRYNIVRLPVGSYVIAIRGVGYTPRTADTVRVEAGQTARVDLTLSLAPAYIEETVITASRTPEKVLDAPASISIIPERQIRERPTVSITEHMNTVPGIDIAKNGLVATNLVARGFNNAFSGSLLMLQDNRFASVPSLRVNIPSLMSATNEDIDRVEVVLGPGAALYGPNASNGVMHVITKSPFDSKGTILTLDGGERSLLRVGARHANTVGERVGFKLSGEYMRGNDWEYRDPAEPTTFPATPSTPAARVGRANARDFDLERYGGEARLDLKLGDASELITTYGGARIVNGLELTGANGTAQIREWRMQHLQTRFRHRRFFAQAFGNLSNAGNEDPNDTRGTFLLRTGQPIVDYSRLGALQFQQGMDWGERQTFLVGADYVFTNPRTGGTIHGRNDEDDNTTEYGGYLHSVTKLSSKWEIVSALRADRNSRLDETFISPRVALVWKPTTFQNLRASYNRAYGTPGSFQLFLDLLQGSLRPTTGLPYDIRAIGVPSDGFAFRRDCAGGVGNLCMRSPVPFANGATGANAFTSAVGYQNALAIAIQGGLEATLRGQYRAQLIAGGAPPAVADAQSTALAAAVVSNLRAANPNSADVGSKLKLLTPGATDPFGRLYSADSVADIQPLKATFVNNFELGYKGIIGGKLRVAVDGWYQRRENFITAATNFTPTVFVDTVTTRAYLTPRLTPILGPAGAAATAAGVAATLARIPAGNVVPDSRLTTNADFAFTYRNIDQTIDLYGSDVAVDMQLTPRLTMAATYSWVSDVEFPEVQNGGFPLSLNAPDHKASLGGRWADDARGYSFDVRGRYANAYFVNSGVFFGQVPVNAFLDAGFSVKLPFADRRTTFGINASNILDNRRASFAGVPEIGRLVLTRLQHTF